MNGDEPSRPGKHTYGEYGGHVYTPDELGRWPSNVTIDEHVAGAIDDQTGDLPGGNYPAQRSQPYATAFGRNSKPTVGGARAMGDAGGASRFFYVAKASPDDRGFANTHPTVKPVELMRYLVRLVTPPGGLVLDPFAGSGTTAQAAGLEGLRCVLVEREPAYVAIIRNRVDAARLDGWNKGEPVRVASDKEPLWRK